MLNGSVKVPESLNGKVFETNGRIVSEIKSLKKINFLVGPNNSGKSFLSRELYKERENIEIDFKLFQIIAFCVKEYLPLLREIVYLIEKEKEHGNFLDFEVIIYDNGEVGFNDNKHINRLVNFDFQSRKVLLASFEYYNRFIRAFEYDPKQVSIDLYLNDHESINLKPHLCEVLVDFVKNVIYDERLLKFNKFVNRKKDANIFINHLRYLSFFSISNSIISHFENIFKLRSGINTKERKFTTGFDFNQDMGNSFTEVDKYQRILEFQKFLGEAFFDNEQVYFVQTNNLELTGSNNQKFSEIQIQIGKENPKFIQQLGTGIQMLIILTWPLFDQDSGVIVIEEPELYLHPGMQRKLMEIYTTHPKSENFQFFISTHSNHILDYAQYIPELTSVYRINKRKEEYNQDGEATFVLENVSSNDLNILADLGVTNSSVFLANCTIWVEGITDIMYIRTYMKYYAKANKLENKYKENLNYMFIPYGGIGNLYHWDFDAEEEGSEKVQSSFLTKKCFLICDGDITTKEPDLAKNLSDVLGENLNILKEDCIEATLLNPIESKARKVKKAQNNINQIDTEAKKLELITEDNVNQLLSPSAIELCEKIYDFIKKSN